jgi:hypothetical protein
MQNKLTIDKNFIPIAFYDGNGLYQNGIFQVNITGMIEHILRSLDNIHLEGS